VRDITVSEMPNYTPPLQIHVAYTKEFAQGPGWSEGLQHWFSGNEGMYSVPAPNIPVFVWSNRSGAIPPDIDWTEAKSTVLILFVDDSFVADPAWRNWADRQWKAKRPADLILPTAITSHFANAGPVFEQTNAIRLDRVPEKERAEDLLLFATHSITRWLIRSSGDAKDVRLFISHAKAKRGKVGGRDLALELKKFAQSKPAGEVFFDEVGIGGGEDFAETIASAIDEAVVIVLLTDVFSSRFWCGWEVVTSKQKYRPLVVVNALEQGEVTSLAYVGKTPTIRWNALTPEEQADVWMHRRIVACALAEHLRLIHDVLHLNAIRELAFPGDLSIQIAARPPELATLPGPAREGKSAYLLHVDPPLPRYELQLMHRHRPDLTLVSAAQALAGCVTGNRPLAGRRVAISISNGPDRDRRGFTINAQERIWTRLATHLLAAGAELAYGGDLRSGGYTEQLIDLAQSTADAGQSLPVGILHWYVGWPTSALLSVKEKAELPAAFALHLGDVPPAVAATADPSWPPSDLNPEHHYAWTLGMREMRLAMAKECHARVLIGGQYRGVSPWPGLFEEFETFIGKPLFLVGALGGTAQLLIDLLHGKTPAEFSESFQDADGQRKPVREYYEQHSGAIDWGGRLERIRQVGVAGLANGLSFAENERLFTTRSDTEILALILKGLSTSTKT
jgi:hypothetical protein